MILIGQFDSPFVRRVGIALDLYGLAFEHRPLSAFGDGDRLAEINPLRRVPTLVLDDGEVVLDSTIILDALDGIVGEARALLPASGSARRHGLKVCALALGIADKSVSLVYERIQHPDPSPGWVARCGGQIEAALDALETGRAALATPFWFGDRAGHADIAVACALRFLKDAHPALWAADRWPGLADHATRCEALPAFSRTSQAFVPPGR